MFEDEKSVNEMTFKQKVEFFQALALFPAMLLLPLIRIKLGFRMLKPIWLIGLTASLFLLGYLSTAPQRQPGDGMNGRPRANLYYDYPRHVARPGELAPIPPTRNVVEGYALECYAILVLICGLYQRRKRWNELCRGEIWHTWSGGFSLFELLGLPVWWTYHRRIYRYLDPAACFAAGFLIAMVFHWLGLVICFCSLFLLIFEQDRYDRSLNRELDILDSMALADANKALITHFTGASSGKVMSLNDTAGVATGAAPDLEAAIAQRRSQQARNREREALLAKEEAALAT